jgi:hypothetical protein
MSMKKIRFSALLIIGVLGILFLPNPVKAEEKQTIVKLPPKSNLTCQQSIDKVKKDLVRRGFFVPYTAMRTKKNSEVLIDNTTIQKEFYGYPIGRTETVEFRLGNTDFFRSPILMSTLASQIIGDCQNIGMVYFGHWYEGGYYFGYFPDNTARSFVNLFLPLEEDSRSSEQFKRNSRKVQTPDGERSQFQWGFYFRR